MAGCRFSIRWLAVAAAVFTLSGGALAAVPAAALDPGVPFAATAVVSPHTVLRGQTNVDVAVTVTNQEGDSIGSTLIRRPNGEFPEPATCGAAPAGWTGTPQASGSFIVDGCRFESAPGAADNIAAGASATFHVIFNVRADNKDAIADSWLVRAHTADVFDGSTAQTVTAVTAGDLDTDVRTFEVNRVVVVDTTTANPNDPCPAPNQTAPVGATRTVLVCGFNRGTSARTPTGAVSSLSGTMFASTGSFSSGSISTGATNRVLTKYTGAVVTGTAGGAKTVVARVGTNTGPATSVVTTLNGFSAYGPVTHLQVTAPASATAGVPITATVAAKDAADVVNADFAGTVHFATSDSQGIVPADLTFAAGDAGTHTFTNGVVLKSAGVRSIDVSAGALIASANVTVNAAPPSQLGLETTADGTGAAVSAQAVTAGSFLTLYSVSRDPYGNFVANATADTWSLIGPTGGVTDTDLVVAPDGKSATFNANLVGTTTIRATRAGLTDANAGLITVVPGAPAALSIGGFADPTTAGDAHAFTVTALDDRGNVAPDYAGTVHFSSSDPAATLPADYTFTPADGGVHVFAATLTTAGERALGVTDTADASRTASQTGITVNPAPASQLRVETQADGTGTAVAAQNVVAGSSISVYAVSRDPYGNFVANVAADDWTLTGKTGGVAFSDLAAAPDGASAVFTGNLVGAATIRASLSGLPSGSSGVITVVPGAAISLVAGGYADPTTAGAAHAFTVTARDDYTNVATGYAGTVHLASSDGAAALPADYTFTPADAGVHAFPITLTTVGDRSITVTDTADATRTATQSAITVVNGPGATITLTGSTAALEVGESRVLTATVRDAYGNAVTTGPDATATVTFAKIAGSGSVSGTGSVAVIAGVATKTVTGTSGGSVTMQASAGFGSPSTTGSNTLTFSVATLYDFTGFLGIGGPPAVTTVKAGTPVPLLFGLGGYQGMDIFADGYPRSVSVPCTFPAATGTEKATDGLGRRDLYFVPFVNVYLYPWTTDRDWKNTCRQLVVKFSDGQTFRANFKFK